MCSSDLAGVVSVNGQVVTELGTKVLRTAGFLGNTADSVCGLFHHGVDLSPHQTSTERPQEML